MFTPTHGIMHYNITMTFQRWITAAYMCCMLGIGTATAAPVNDAAAAYLKGDYAHAIKIFRPLAAQGLAQAQLQLGLSYNLGKGVTKDYQQAVKWSRLTADQGDAYTQYSLGWMYVRGKGLTQDYQESAKRYHLTATQGLAQAQLLLGLSYNLGKGVTKDDREALK